MVKITKLALSAGDLILAGNKLTFVYHQTGPALTLWEGDKYTVNIELSDGDRELLAESLTTKKFKSNPKTRKKK